MNQPTLQILGTRGIPAGHGGFEAFAEMFALYLVQQGWYVRVYCQRPSSERFSIENWKGVELYKIPVPGSGAFSTIHFDIVSMRMALKCKIPILTLGYNTAFLNALPRLKGIPNIINMDGIEWKRGKWGSLEKAFFYLNEHLGARFGDHLIADHPEIQRHLRKRAKSSKITVIPYSAKWYGEPQLSHLHSLDLRPKTYLTVVARSVPENQILEIVQAFSRRKRGVKLLVLGRYEPDVNPYHRKVHLAASEEVLFPGPIYQPQIASIRQYALGYLHGHTVGGTNPSLVEALHAGNPVLAADNPFNRWVAGSSALYFSSVSDLERILDRFLHDPQRQEDMKEGSRKQYQRRFAYQKVMEDCKDLIVRVVRRREN